MRGGTKVSMRTQSRTVAEAEATSQSGNQLWRAAAFSVRRALSGLLLLIVTSDLGLLHFSSLLLLSSCPALILTLRLVYDFLARHALPFLPQLERRRSCVSRFTANTLYPPLHLEDVPEPETQQDH